MEEILALLGQIDPVWGLITVMTGIILGFFSRDIEFDIKSLFLITYFYIPFVLVRLIAFAIGGTPFLLVGAGTVGAVFLTMYGIAFFIGRKFG